MSKKILLQLVRSDSDVACIMVVATIDMIMASQHHLTLDITLNISRCCVVVISANLCMLVDAEVVG